MAGAVIAWDEARGVPCQHAVRRCVGEGRRTLSEDKGGEPLFHFRSFQRAASFALRCRVPAIVIDGPEDYVVAVGRKARELKGDGHAAYTLSETAQAERDAEYR